MEESLFCGQQYGLVMSTTDIEGSLQLRLLFPNPFVILMSLCLLKIQALRLNNQNV